jgi:hypothetical protein
LMTEHRMCCGFEDLECARTQSLLPTFADVWWALLPVTAIAGLAEVKLQTGAAGTAPLTDFRAVHRSMSL